MQFKLERSYFITEVTNISLHAIQKLYAVKIIKTKRNLM